MPIYRLDENEIWFPPHGESDNDVMAVGGDLSPERLITAYANGIFPWYEDESEILWWSPQERCVIFTNEIKVSKSMRNVLNRNQYRVTLDEAFTAVMEGCRAGERVNNTWIHDEVITAFTKLHEIGIAHSVEVWDGPELVGGLYGVSLGRVFFGESMFSKVPNSSKIALIRLNQHLSDLGWKIIDCQIYNDHLATLGAKNISRETFLEILEVELKYPTQQGKWTFSQ